MKLDRVQISVRPGAALADRPQLFSALEQAFPVDFRPWTDADPQIAGVIEIVADPGLAEVAAVSVPSFVAAAGAADDPPFVEVELADAPGVDPRLRGVTLRERIAGSPLSADADVLAAAGRTAVWTRDGAVDRVRCVLPELEPQQVLYALLSQRAIATVALVQFLRGITDASGWQPPPLRAAFVFDDPNLRWRSYGFIDYCELVAHADEHGYHVAMATIPLDAVRPHRETLRLFKERADRLSLVFHGNNHVKNELLMPGDDRTALAMAAQAMRRIQRFERKYGLAVERVMMPPHGRCSQHTARALTAVGFDALSAIHPLPWTAERPSSPPLVAWTPAEFVGGCAVIPRTALTSTVADLALRAFLDHPMIVYGHHEDVASGLDCLADAAARVNRTGDVRWTSVGEIARTNAMTQLEGERLAVLPFSRRVRVDVPERATTLTVSAPRPAGTELELRGWSVDGGLELPFGAEVELTGPGAREVLLHGVHEADPAAVTAPGWRPWPKLRRATTELRDRALPLIPARAR